MYWTTPSGTRYHTGCPVCDAIAAVRRRDGEGRNLELTHIVGRQARRAQDVTGSGDGDEVGEVPQLIMVPPTENLRYGVGAGDEEQLRVGSLRSSDSRRVSIV